MKTTRQLAAAGSQAARLRVTSQVNQTELLLLIGKLQGEMGQVLHNQKEHAIELGQLQEKVQDLGKARWQLVGGVTVVSALVGWLVQALVRFIPNGIN